MKSLREIAGESKGNYSNLGDIKHKFEFHSDCVGLHFPELSDPRQRFTGQQRNRMSDVPRAVVCFPEVRGLRS